VREALKLNQYAGPLPLGFFVELWWVLAVLRELEPEHEVDVEFEDVGVCGGEGGDAEAA
jgi:hypothetical protein